MFTHIVYTIICLLMIQIAPAVKNRVKGSLYYVKNVKKKWTGKAWQKTCAESNCGTAPFFGLKSDMKAIYCADHKDATKHVDVRNKTCQDPSCDTQASFGLKSDMKAIYCAEHKNPTKHVDVRHKLCQDPLCATRPNFGLKSDMKAIFCAKHKDATKHIDVVNKTCQDPLCVISPSFGLKSDMKAIFCVIHRDATKHVDVNHILCQDPLCITRPTFGLISDMKAIFCADHRDLSKHVNVKDKTCQNTLCNKIPSFGLKSDMKAIFCADHKDSKKHVDVRNKTCQDPSCDTQASFGLKSDRKPLFCAKHKDATKHVDVSHNICIEVECNVRANFGQLFQNKIHCAKHRKTNEYLDNKPKCTESKCKARPIYTNQNNNWPLRCETHQLKDDINIIEKVCASCHSESLIKEGNTLCTGCMICPWIERKPRKENEVRDYLIANKISFVQDKRADKSCSQKRPDFVIDCGTHIIIVEVDENQHSSYPCQCEQGRMITIYNDYGGLPVTFIRYNPDDYKDHQGKKQLGKNQERKRLNRLLNAVKSLQMHPPNNVELKVLYLYYNNDDGKDMLEILNYDKMTSSFETMKLI